MLTGGSSLVANSIMIGLCPYQYDSLSKENPEMGTAAKLGNAAVNGTLKLWVSLWKVAVTYGKAS
jgi:hypothetical protein